MDHIPKLRRLRLQVLFIRVPTNKGPVPYIRKEVEWDRPRDDVLGMRKLLEALVAETAEKLIAREYPELQLQIERCNVHQDPDFMLKICEHCRCPYCELTQ